MKLSTGSIVVIVVFIIVILVSLFGTAVSFKPYNERTIFSKQFPYEGFATVKSTEYTTYPNHNSIDSYTAHDVKPITGPSRLWGFDGLYSSPDSDDNSLDVFSKAKSSNQCKSSGLSNSTGFLCLDENQQKLLGSRGGNARGASSQIGK